MEVNVICAQNCAQGVSVRAQQMFESSIMEAILNRNDVYWNPPEIDAPENVELATFGIDAKIVYVGQFCGCKDFSEGEAWNLNDRGIIVIGLHFSSDASEVTCIVFRA